MSKHGPHLPEVWAVKKVMRPLLNTLAHLHARGIVHRDIKPGNILFDGQQVLRLADFGLAVDLGAERANTRVGTLAFMAPEIVRCPTKASPLDNKDTPGGPEYSAAADVWACGVLMYAMLTGSPAFPGQTDVAVVGKITSTDPLQHLKLNLPDHIMSRAAKDFIAACLQPVAADRPTVRELLQHPLIALAGSASSPRPQSGLLTGSLSRSLGSGAGLPASEGAVGASAAEPRHSSGSGASRAPDSTAISSARAAAGSRLREVSSGIGLRQI